MKDLKKPRYFIPIIVLLILAGAFYWFQWNPSQIRKECTAEARNKLNESIDDKLFNIGLYELGPIEELDNYYDLAFKICIAEKGLVK